MVSAKPLWSALRNLLVMFIFENEYPKGQHICAHSVTHYALGISNFRFCFVLYFSLPNNLFSTLSSTAWVVFFFFYFIISLKLVCALVHRTTGDVASPETVNPRGTLSVDNRSCQMDVGSSRIKLFPTNLNGLVIEGWFLSFGDTLLPKVVWCSPDMEQAIEMPFLTVLNSHPR